MLRFTSYLNLTRGADQKEKLPKGGKMSKKRQESILERCEAMAREIGITKDQVQEYEDCERISDILGDDIVRLIDDVELRTTIIKMRRLHRKIRAQHSAPFISKAKDLYGKLPAMEHVLAYHCLEQLLEKIDDSSIEAITDPEMRALMSSIKHVHDKGYAERKAQIFHEIMAQK